VTTRALARRRSNRHGVRGGREAADGVRPTVVVVVVVTGVRCSRRHAPGPPRRPWPPLWQVSCPRLRPIKYTTCSRVSPGTRRMVGRQLDPRYRRRRVIGMQRRRRSPILPARQFLPGLSVVEGCGPYRLGDSAARPIRDGVAIARGPGPRVPIHGPARASGKPVLERLRPEFDCPHGCTDRRQRLPGFRPPVLGHHVASESERAEAASWPQRRAGEAS
jgi:hypothetical protein